jgi:hypothetical protein
LKFEHLVIVNEPANPLIADLSREQLWFGLLCRAEDPRPFLPGLDACTIVERSDNVLVRDLQFGKVLIRDRVELTPMQSVSFESEPTDEHAGGRLTITIEEPEPDALMLRFVYRTTLPEGGLDPDGAFAEFVKAAYHESDLDTVRVIRMIAESGRPQ